VGDAVVDKTTFQCTRPGVFFGGDAAWGPENIIWAVAHGHEAAISIHNQCTGVPLTERPAQGMNLISQKMGIHEWSYSNDYDRQAPEDEHVATCGALRADELEVEQGFDPEQRARGRALPQLRRQTAFTDQVHRVRRLHRRLPRALPDHRPRREERSCARLRAGDEPKQASTSRMRCRRPTRDR
jgi:hypothetical protein